MRAELDRAHTYRERIGDRRFVIPVRIDDVPLDELSLTTSNRTMIDAHENHAAALARIIKTLEEDEVPRSTSPSADALFRWQRAFGPGDRTVETVEDSLVSNWFPILSLPKTIHFYEITRPLKNVVTEPATIAKNHPLPMAAYWRRLVSFAQWDEVQEPIADTTPVKFDRSMSLDNFMAGGNADTSLEWGEPGKILQSLLRQAFDRMAERKGLKPYNLSERKIAWWAPDGLVEDNRARFTRVSGLTGWRKLSGVYSARGRNWHFGVNAVPMLGDPLHLRLTPHTVYTNPAGEGAPTVDFRRAHCKLWFNSKWRDLLYGLVTYLADQAGEIRLPFGRMTHAVVAASPIAVTLPVRPSAALEATSSETADRDGDAADLDVSDYANDPAFTALIEEEESEGLRVDDDTDGGEDEA